MANIWITYAWDDNEHNDVDFVAQELGREGLDVKLDRWNIASGRRLWEQIERFICERDESDAWLLVATNNSLASEPCKEEFAYAMVMPHNAHSWGAKTAARFRRPSCERYVPTQ